MLVSGDDSGVVKTWDLDTHRAHSSVSCCDGAVLGLMVVGPQMLTQSKNGTLKLWDWEAVNTTSSGVCKPTCGIDVDIHSFCKFIHVGDEVAEPTVVAAPARGGIDVGLWDVRTQELRPHFRPALHDGASTSPTGMCSALCRVSSQHLLGAYEDGTVRLWDLRRANAVASQKLHSEPIFGLASGPAKTNSSAQLSSAHCVSGGADGCVVFSHLDDLDRPLLADEPHHIRQTGDDNNASCPAVVAGLLTEKCRIDLGGSGAKGINSIAVRDDGKIAAAGCWDGRTRVYACKKPRLLASLRCHTKGVQCAAFSDRTRLLASASEDTRIAVWDIYRS